MSIFIAFFYCYRNYCYRYDDDDDNFLRIFAIPSRSVFLIASSLMIFHDCYNSNYYKYDCHHHYCRIPILNTQ